MARLFRIARSAFAPSPSAAFDGEGAFRGGSRWNTPGRRLSFASTSESLAQLEYLAHIDWAATLTDELTLIVGSIDDRYIEAASAAALPADWKQTPPSGASAAFGDAWIAGGGSAALLVPSALVEDENNVLLNPLHKDFSNVRVDSMRPFAFDGRLLKKA